MGFSSWLSGAVEKAKSFGKTAIDSAKTFIGKARGGVQKGLQIYEQGKELYDQGKSQYSQAKSQLSSLPVIGAMASEQLGKLEGQAGQVIERAAERGISSKNLELAAGLARRGLRETQGMM
jgi:predicted heme/steroid binding protein